MAQSPEDAPRYLTERHPYGDPRLFAGFGDSAGEDDIHRQTPLSFDGLGSDYEPSLRGTALETPSEGADEVLDRLMASGSSEVVGLPAGDDGSRAIAIATGVHNRPLWLVHVLDYGKPGMPFYGFIQRERLEDRVLYTAVSVDHRDRTESLPDTAQLEVAQAALNALAEHTSTRREAAKAEQRRQPGSILLRRLLGRG